MLKSVYLSEIQFNFNSKMSLASLLLRGLDELTLKAILKRHENVK